MPFNGDRNYHYYEGEALIDPFRMGPLVLRDIIVIDVPQQRILITSGSTRRLLRLSPAETKHERVSA